MVQLFLNNKNSGSRMNVPERTRRCTLILTFVVLVLSWGSGLPIFRVSVKKFNK